MSLAEGWRTFNFFNNVPLPDPHDPSKKAVILQGLDLFYWTPADDSVLFGEQSGAVFHLSKNLDVRFWKAYKQCLFDFSYRDNVVFTIGEDDSLTQFPILKLWDLAHWDESMITPKCKLTYAVNPSGRKSTAMITKPISIAVNTTLTFLAVGFGDTSVFTFCGDLQRDRSPRFRSLRDGAATLGEGQLVGLVVATVQGNRTAVFVVTDKALTSYVLDSNGTLLRTIIHDAKGCEPHCWHFSDVSRQLVIAGKEMVYFYDLEECLQPGNENGRCHALARYCDKIQLLCVGGFVCLLTKQQSVIGQHKDQPDDDKKDEDKQKQQLMSVLHLYNVEHRYVAFYASMPTICKLFLLGGEIYILNAEGALSRLLEEPLSSKLAILLKKNLFDLAISITRDQNTPGLLKDMHLKYGDYLYKKGDFENAIQQYVETVGLVEPSYVIRKFLDGPRVAQLCTYLELLLLQDRQEKNIAAGQHAILLVSAYVKMNNVKKLDEFLEKYTIPDDFETEEAISILTASKFHRQASKLALKQKMPQRFLSILITDLKEYDQALNFIAKQSEEQACTFLQEFGNVLFENREAETFQLIKKVALSHETNIQKLLGILLNHPQHLEELFSAVVSGDGQIKDLQVRNKILELRMQRMSKQKEPISSDQQLSGLLRLIDVDNYAHALHLAQIYKIGAVVIHILKKQNRMDDLLRYLLQEGNVLDIVDLCGEDALKDMWIELITYLSSMENSPTAKDQLIALLEKATQTNFIQPLVLLEVLARNDSLTVGDVRNYVLGWLERQYEQIAENETAIQRNEQNLDEMVQKIDDLENNTQVFNVSKCSVCTNNLQIPAVHFLCKHSFHLNCYESYSGTNPDQCPACVADSAVSISRDSHKEEDSKQSQLSLQRFKHELENCTDAASLISRYIALGIFDSPAAVADDQPQLR